MSFALLHSETRREKRRGEVDKKPVKVIHRVPLKDHILYDTLTEGDLIDINEYQDDQFTLFEPKIKGLPLVTSGDVENVYDPQLKVIKSSGNVFIESFAHNEERLRVGDYVRKWDKIFTQKSSIVQFEIVGKNMSGNILMIEFGSKTVAQLTDIDVRERQVDVLLLSGRARARMSKGQVKVRTPTSTVWIYGGYADVIITAMNTLVAPRIGEDDEGEDVVVKTIKAIKRVKPGFYGLANESGSLIITRGTSDRIEAEAAIISRREKKEPFKDSKPLMRVNKENKVRRRGKF